MTWMFRSKESENYICLSQNINLNTVIDMTEWKNPYNIKIQS